MLARCPHCGVAHAVARSPDLQQGRVRCNACGETFELFTALEIAGAGTRADGPGITPVVSPGRPRIVRSLRPARAQLDIEASSSALASPAPHATRGRQWPRPLISLALATILLLQVLLVPPVAPGTHPGLDQLRALLCDISPCPHWGAPGAIRLSPPEWTEDRVRMRLQVHFELQSAVAQPWPGLEIVLSDALGTEHGRLWLPPERYRPPGAARLEAGRVWPITLTLESPHPHISGMRITAR